MKGSSEIFGNSHPLARPRILDDKSLGLRSDWMGTVPPPPGHSRIQRFQVEHGIG